MSNAKCKLGFNLSIILPKHRENSDLFSVMWIWIQVTEITKLISNPKNLRAKLCFFLQFIPLDPDSNSRFGIRIHGPKMNTDPDPHLSLFSMPTGVSFLEYSLHWINYLRVTQDCIGIHLCVNISRYIPLFYPDPDFF